MKNFFNMFETVIVLNVLTILEYKYQINERDLSNKQLSDYIVYLFY